MKFNREYDVIVIGGGAAGCFAAIKCAEYGNSVCIIEPNQKLGRKLAITGKGRCNVTNNSDNETILKNIPRNPSFMYSALNGFSARDCMDFFEGLGVPLKTERGNRVFPVSDKAYDIVDALYREINRLNVTIIHDRAKHILAENGAAAGVDCGKSCYGSQKVILATGGMSYPVTGSTGDGYRMAAELGHTVTPIKPSLVPLVTVDDCSVMMGLSLKNVVLSLKDEKKGKVLFSEIGEMLFTHFGISGPLVLSASSYINEMESDRYTAYIDLKPGLDRKQLDLRVQRDFREMQNKVLSNALVKLLPSKLILPFIKKAGLDPEKRVNEFTREERMKLLDCMKAFPIIIRDFRPVDEAIITDGGISVKEINPKTMESKLINGLYFAGEIIDVTGFTGGFNLQIAFSTANAAALG